MNLSDIEKSANEIISKIGINKKDMIDAIKVGGIISLIYAIYKIWKRSTKNE